MASLRYHNILSSVSTAGFEADLSKIMQAVTLLWIPAAATSNWAHSR